MNESWVRLDVVDSVESVDLVDDTDDVEADEDELEVGEPMVRYLSVLSFIKRFVYDSIRTFRDMILSSF